MKLLSSIFKISNKPSVIDSDVLTRQIHDEVDSLDQQYIDQVEKMLSELKIPTIDRIENKATIMKKLGFGSNNEVIKEYDKIQEIITENTRIIELNKSELELLNKYRIQYPKDKIIPMDAFTKVLEKYDLIYAPSEAYIKDVPEKNLLEIKNAKPVLTNQQANSISYVSDVHIDKYYFTKNELKRIKNYFEKPRFFKRNISYQYKILAYTEDILNEIITNGYVKYACVYKEITKDAYIKRKNRSLYDEIIDGVYPQKMKELVLENADKFKKTSIITNIDENIEEETPFEMRKRIGEELKIKISTYLNIGKEIINRSSLFIAAPKTHFNLSEIANFSGRKYYAAQKAKITEITDPIAFYLLKGIKDNNEFVRIVSKWGDSSDQAYLDPILQDERMN